MTTQSELLSKAPEGATHFVPDSGTGILTWYKKINGEWHWISAASPKCYWERSVANDGYLEKYATPIDIPQPDKEDWFKVGAVCELVSLGMESMNDEVTITYIGNRVGCYVKNSNGMEFTFSIDEAVFRPIKSEREKCLDAANNIAITSLTHTDMLERLYDAGLLRIREDK